MQVIAKKGTRCPKEDNHRDYIADDEPHDVPETAYYMRLIEDGSIIRAAETETKKKGGKT